MGLGRLGMPSLFGRLQLAFGAKSEIGRIVLFHRIAPVCDAAGLIEGNGRDRATHFVTARFQPRVESSDRGEPLDYTALVSSSLKRTASRRT